MPKKVASKSPSFNIIEEYTLDEDTKSTKQVINTSDAAGNVVTSGGVGKTATLHKAVRNDSMKEIGVIKSEGSVCSGAASLPVETGSNRTTSAPTTEPEQKALTTRMPSNKSANSNPRPVTCPEDGILLSQFPWKYKLKVQLERVSEIESDIWCNSVIDYYKFTPTPEASPVIKVVKGYGLRKRQSKEHFDLVNQSQPDTTATDQLIDQAKALINTAKTFVTKPVKRKHSSKSGSSSTSTSKTRPKVKALDVLQEQTVRKLTTFHVGTDGSMNANTDVPPSSKCRKIRCKLCENTFSSVKELNIHHHKDHGIVNCPKCGKYFSTQSLLDKHSYSHREAKFTCELCGQCFQFESRLNQHMVTHITKKLPCPVKSCDREKYW